MADGSGSGGIGILGVIIGALIVVAVGYLFMVNGGHFGSGPSTNVKIEVPKSK
jgi:hypothetical protein